MTFIQRFYPKYCIFNLNIFIPVDQLQAEIDRRLDEGSNSLPPQSEDEKNKLQAFDESFITTPEEDHESLGHKKPEHTKQSFGPEDPEDGGPPEDEEDEEQGGRILTNMDDYERKELMGRKTVQC